MAEAKEWLRNLSSDEALKVTTFMTQGVVRGERGKDEDLKLIVPSAETERTPSKPIKPFAHPKYWAAFVLIGDPH